MIRKTSINQSRVSIACLAASFAWLSIAPASIAQPDVHVVHINEGGPKKDEPAKLSWQALCDDYLDFYMRTAPNQATQAGVHTYDDKLADMSEESRKKTIAELQRYLDKLYSIDYKTLSADEQVDWNLLAGHANQQLLDLNEIQYWRKNPDTYSSLATESVFCLIQRDFAPLEDRLTSVIAREEALPAFLALGKRNLDAEVIPEIYNEIALEQLPGIIDFFENTLPSVFKPVKDQEKLAKFNKSNADAIAALKDYQSYVKEYLSGKSVGQFAIGENNYKRKLLNEELAEETIDQLLDEGMTELRRLQRDFKETTAKIDPKLSAAKNQWSVADANKAFETVSSNHPEPDKLIESVKSVLEEIRTYCIKKPICTIPSEERARVDETPPFDRALSFASMSTPGPFEKKAREAFYYVTLPEKSWDAKRTEEHMRSFSFGDLLNTSVHEAYPGHYTQFLWVNHAPSSVRKMFGCSSNAEGWAHYAEQMMLDEDFHKGDVKLRAIQIHDALLRMARYIVGIRMHTRGMTMEEGIKFFMEEGYQEKANAERETKRGTMDPTYLVYTYGKLKILALRNEVQKKSPETFDLRAFHDSFLKEGYPPIALVRSKILQQPVRKYFEPDKSR